METTIVYWGYIGIMEKKMKTTIVAATESDRSDVGNHVHILTVATVQSAYRSGVS